MRTREVDVEDQIAGVVRRLVAGSAAVDPSEIETEVRRCFADWADAPVREFVPIFVERMVRRRLGLKVAKDVAREVAPAS